jgi:hypothetical protein
LLSSDGQLGSSSPWERVAAYAEGEFSIWDTDRESATRRCKDRVWYKSIQGRNAMSAFAWPICVCFTVLILGLVILFRYRDAISRFIDRTKHIGKAGVTTSDSTALATQTEVKDTFEKPSAADELLKSFDNQLLVSRRNSSRIS